MKQKEEQNNYFKKLRAPAQSKLNGGNIIKVKNTWPMSTIRYETGFINREIKYLKCIDTKTVKLLDMDGGLSTRTDVDHMYISRDLVGRALKFCWKGLCEGRNAYYFQIYCSELRKTFGKVKEKEKHCAECLEKKAIQFRFLRNTGEYKNNRGWEWL